MKTEIETLKQEIEQIESTFLPKEEIREDYGYTKNAEEWIEFIKTNRNTSAIPNRWIFDYELIKNAEAFALSPVFSYQGKIIQCVSRTIDSLTDFKNELKEKKYILYAVCYSIVIPTDQIEKNFFDNILNSKLRYIFRGYILD
jgi:hypothetical protein